ncbi:hypothetical protein JM93_02960 [Roseibium hamelinense]|uniref:Uncharacterized protein n=1 Tax=Roseibium hamelinense TaxID=150831 RepID=A0A562SUB8_9HYPH|nr:hypothetical protein [Roseibium hamelinense]MTI43069.1 hypothetical protein [Roseibium hamelinense]TWI84628.1 hypothetical protein JM93_02960 [Roseibium hamelinense]
MREFYLSRDEWRLLLLGYTAGSMLALCLMILPGAPFKAFLENRPVFEVPASPLHESESSLTNIAPYWKGARS